MSKAAWFQETRPQFLTLSVALVLHGSALAYWQGSFEWVRFVLTLVALLLMHVATNVLNDWHDFKSGIDLAVERTPFSGGSGLLPAGAVSSRGVLVMGVASLLAGCAIGVYLAYLAGWTLLIIGAVGAFAVVTYTPLLNRVGLGEIFAGLGMGYLPIVGAYFVFAERLDSIVWIAAIPAGLLTYNLLLLNEFPDADADKAGGRRHMVILLGKRNAGVLYTLIELGVYVAIVAGVLFGDMTPWALLGLGGLIVAAKAIGGALKDYDSFEGLIPAQGANVMAVLATNVLLAVGYLIAGLVG